MPRLNLASTHKEAYGLVRKLDGWTRTAVDAELLELIKIRASILNGCGFCIDMHSTEARGKGVAVRKLLAVGGWQHAGDLFTERERAAFALTDAMTKLSADSITAEIWDRARAQFSEEEIGSLVFAISTINVWNRIAISSGMTPPVDDAHPIV